MTRSDLIVVTFHIMLLLLSLLLLQLEVSEVCCGWCTLTLVGPKTNGVLLLDSLHFVVVLLFVHLSVFAPSSLTGSVSIHLCVLKRLFKYSGRHMAGLIFMGY